MRFRLHTLLILLTWIGPVCLALRSPTPFWSGVIFAVMLLALLTSVLVIICRRGRTRAFAVGFLAFGGVYLVLIFHTGGGTLAVGKGGNPLGYLGPMLYEQIHGDWVVPNRGSSHHNAFVAIIHTSTAKSPRDDLRPIRSSTSKWQA